MNNKIDMSKSSVLGNVMIVYLIVFAIGASSSVLVNRYPNISTTVLGIVLNLMLFSVILVKTIVIDKLNLQSIGITFNNLPKKVLVGFVISICQMAVYLSILVFVFGLSPDVVVMGREKMSVGAAVLKTLYYVLFVGVAEEAIYRGYFFTKLNSAFRNKVFVVLFISVLFSCSHLVNMQIVQLVETLIVSSIYCVLRYNFKDKSITPLIIAHGIFNSLPIWLGILFFW